MLIYNVTIHIAPSAEADFVAWMQNEHIQEVLATQCFHKAIFLKNQTENTEKYRAYTCQYFCATATDLDHYYQEFAPALRQKGQQKFGKAMVGTRTEFQVLAAFENP